MTVEPVVLDEAQDRALIGKRVVDIVLLGVRGDHQQRQAWTIAATPLSMGHADTRQGVITLSAFTRTGKRILLRGGLVSVIVGIFPISLQVIRIS